MIDSFGLQEWIILVALLLGMAILLTISALISASEVAFFSFKDHEIEDLKSTDKKGDLISELLSKPEKLLATILITNNAVNIALVLISSIFMTKIHVLGGPTIIYTILQVVIITALLLLFGEIIPKVYATQKGIQIAQLMAKPLQILIKIFSVFTSGLVRLSKALDSGRVIKRSLSVDELSEAHELIKDEQTTEHEQKMLDGILEFGTTEVTQIMKSRTDVKAISTDSTFEKVREIIIDSGHSRIPVFQDSIDNIKGILYVKDLLPHLEEGNEFHWMQLIRTPFFVPPSKKLDDLLREFQEKKIHLAIVVDEYGGTEGIITLEDIIEEIVGDIRDEFDDDDLKYSVLNENTFIFEAKTPLLDMFRVAGIKSEDFDDVKSDSDTIAGFILEKTGSFPKWGQTIKVNHFAFTIESIDRKRIKRVKLEINEAEVKR